MGSIPVRVTTSIAHNWLNKADCELLFFPKNRLVRCLSAILKILLIHDLRFQFPLVKKSECAVHSFCYSRLCIPELMRVNIQGLTPNEKNELSHGTRLRISNIDFTFEIA